MTPKEGSPLPSTNTQGKRNGREKGEGNPCHGWLGIWRKRRGEDPYRSYFLQQSLIERLKEN